MSEPNIWRPYSDRGQPFGDHLFAEITPSLVGDMAPRLGSLFLSNAAIWIGVALVFAGPDVAAVRPRWIDPRPQAAARLVGVDRGADLAGVRVGTDPAVPGVDGGHVGATLVTPWYPLPEGGDATHLLVPLLGDDIGRSASLWPCVNQASVEHGIAAAPEVTLLADENFRRSFLDIAFRIRQGGTQVQTDRTSAAVRMPARLAAPGPPTLPWGRVERVVYDHPVGLVDLRTDQQRRWGVTRLPTLSGEDYNGYRSGSAPWNTTR